MVRDVYMDYSILCFALVGEFSTQQISGHQLCLHWYPLLNYAVHWTNTSFLYSVFSFFYFFLFWSLIDFFRSISSVFGFCFSIFCKVHLYRFVFPSSFLIRLFLLFYRFSSNDWFTVTFFLPSVILLLIKIDIFLKAFLGSPS